MSDKQGQKPVAMKKTEKKHLTIAIQGGGTHGAFAGGVLDRIFEEKDIIVSGVTGSGTGGVNAVCVAQGIMDGGNEGVRELLKRYWLTSCKSSFSNAFSTGTFENWFGGDTMKYPREFMLFDQLVKTFSPYHLNFSWMYFQREIIQKLFHFDKLNEFDGVKVFLSAIQVYASKLKIFSNINRDLSSNAIAAVICLPSAFNSVSVDGEYYWTCESIGNPTIYPLVYECNANDVMLIKLGSTHRNRLPFMTMDILNRANEISSNISVKNELDLFLSEKIRIHLIENEKFFQNLDWSSKFNGDERFLNYLFNAGRVTADQWLEKYYDKIGEETTVSIGENFV